MSQVCSGLTGKRDYCPPAVYTSEPDRLYHNEGNGTFKDVSGGDPLPFTKIGRAHV